MDDLKVVDDGMGSVRILQIELFSSSMERMALIQPEAVEGIHLM